MIYEILTLFPDWVDAALNVSILARARKSGLIEVRTSDIRAFSTDKHRKVDDTPCGGGKGMLMACPPVCACHAAAMERLKGKKVRSICLSPQGKPFTQKKAAELAGSFDALVLLCGHYEGIDRRAVELCCDEEISIGDYVLTGGELPACVLVDCVSRLIPGVLADKVCYEKESFSRGLLEEPQYTRPLSFGGLDVPEVLLSGDHKKIEEWRYRASLDLTEKNRPDLL